MGYQPSQVSQIADQLWTANAQSLLREHNAIKGKELLDHQDSLSDTLKHTKIGQEIISITNSIRHSITDSKISNLAPEIGGQFSKEGIELNSQILNFNIDQTRKDIAERINHIYKHEKQHQLQNDAEPLLLIGNEFIFGGQIFTPTEIIEAINMHNTGTHTTSGKQTVSHNYIRMHQKLSKALSSSVFDLKTLTKALTNRDLTHLDDRLN